MKPQQPLTVGVILARKGSKGIPNKNLVELYGKPIIQYTIDFAKETQTVDTLILSTDSRSIADLGIRSGIQTLIRPSEYATDEAPIDLALRHAVRNFESSNQTIDIIVVLYGNVPIRKPGIIDQVVKELRSTGADSVETYAPYIKPPQRAYKIDSGIPIPLTGVHVESYRRQDLEPLYYPDGAVLAIKRDVLMATEGTPGETGRFIGTDRRAVVQSPEDTVDVDELVDLLWAEFLISREEKKFS